jgi:poly(hydroxyalkanoate) depolymerase family esterase
VCAEAFREGAVTLRIAPEIPLPLRNDISGVWEAHRAADLAPGAPLIVVLHGCKQKAVTFARDAGWLALADRSRLALVLPEQKGLPSHLHDVYLLPGVVALWGANNQNACFNWFEPDDTARDRGEALSIRQMIDAVVERHSVDRSRVYVAGFSAGGAMTAAMVAAYPERFAGGAIIAGVPYGCADTVSKALQCMNRGMDRAPAEWRRHVRDVAGAERRIPQGSDSRLMSKTLDYP